MDRAINSTQKIKPLRYRSEIGGLTDSSLTSGSYVWSGKPLPMMKVQLAISGYLLRQRCLASTNFMPMDDLQITVCLPIRRLIRRPYIIALVRLIGINHQPPIVEFSIRITWGGVLVLLKETKADKVFPFKNTANRLYNIDPFRIGLTNKTK